MIKEGSGIRVYKPLKGSARAALFEHFANNPQANITRKEIMEQFGLTEKAMDNALSKMLRAGILESRHAYRLSNQEALGMVVAAVAPKPAKTPRKAAPKPAKRERPSQAKALSHDFKTGAELHQVWARMGANHG